MMILKHVMGLVGGCAVLGMVATGAQGQVYARAEATMLIRFTEVREITHGTPVGSTGLNLHRGSLHWGAGAYQPFVGASGTSGGFAGPPVADPGSHVPSPNTGFSYGTMFETTTTGHGFGSTGVLGSHTMEYVNVTSGQSEYEIDGEVSITISLISDLTDPVRERVVLSGEVLAIISDENIISLRVSEFMSISGANASGSISSPVYPFTMRIGNIGGGFRRDYASIRFEVSLLATIQAVPTPGTFAIISMACLLAMRRHRG